MTPKLLDPVLLQTDFPDLQLHASGKVRDVYQIDNDRLLFVATDRISAFDYILATGIPNKGRVLTQISLFWFDFLSDIVPNHLITADVARYPQALVVSAREPYDAAVLQDVPSLLCIYGDQQVCFEGLADVLTGRAAVAR